MKKLRQLTLDRFGLRFRHTEELLKRTSELKKMKHGISPESKEFQRVGRLCSNDLKRAGEQEGLKVLSVGVYGSTKTGLAKRGSDIDLNVIVRVKNPKNTRKELNALFEKINSIPKDRYGSLTKNEVMINVNVYPEHEINEEILKNPFGMYSFLISKPLLGRKEHNQIRKKIIDVINKNPKLIEEIKPHEIITENRIKKKTNAL